MLRPGTLNPYPCEGFGVRLVSKFDWLTAYNSVIMLLPIMTTPLMSR